MKTNSLTQILHPLHQYAYLPVLLFLVACVIALASFNGQKQGQKWFGYLLAVALVVASVFMIRM